MDRKAKKLLRLGTIARKIVENGKGIIAIDESSSTIYKRFLKYNIENTEENRRKYRQLILSANFNNMVGGVIFHEETFEQSTDSGKLFVDILIKEGVSPGIKLDKGLIDFKTQEKVSVGLEDLDKKLKSGKYQKADFAKWRSVFMITENTPTKECIHENCSVLAQYASICQKYGIVPILEPELLWEGDYEINEGEQIMKSILSCLFYHLNLNKIYIPGVLLKVSFVTPGKDSMIPNNTKRVGSLTFSALMSTVPVSVPGIVFLSGGHSTEDAINFLNSVNKEKGQRTWKLSFSFGRALTDDAMRIWKGEDKNINEAIGCIEELLNKAFLASQGKLKYDK